MAGCTQMSAGPLPVPRIGSSTRIATSMPDCGTTSVSRCAKAAGVGSVNIHCTGTSRAGPFADLGDQSGGHHRVAAEVEEVVVQSDSGYAEDGFEGFGQGAFGRRFRGAVGALRGLEYWSR